MKTIGIVAKWSTPEALRATVDLDAWLRARGLEPLVERTSLPEGHALGGVSGETLAERSDLLVVLGGDGTFIHTSGLVGARSIPILGVNLGTLGFLAEIELADLYPTLERVLNGDYQTETRMRLFVQLWRGEELRGAWHVVNDAVVTKGALARIIQFEVTVGGELLSRYKGDGILACTPTGSTAYNLAAGGPVLRPTVPAFVITPICPHALTQRPIVMDAEAVCRIRPVSSPGRVFLTVDGREVHELSTDDVVEVSRSPHPTVIVRAPSRNFFAVLHQKLQWGSR